jgi:hypothetical protein
VGTDSLSMDSETIGSGTFNAAGDWSMVVMIDKIDWVLSNGYVHHLYTLMPSRNPPMSAITVTFSSGSDSAKCLIRFFHQNYTKCIYPDTSKSSLHLLVANGCRSQK